MERVAAVPGATTLSFLHDPVNPPVASCCKDVRSLLVDVDPGRGVSVLALVPGAAETRVLAQLPVAGLRAAVPEGVCRQRGLLPRLLTGLYAGGERLAGLQARAFDGNGSRRPGLVVSAAVDGDVLFWLWSPLQLGDGAGPLQFLCKGPAELDEVADFQVCQFLDEDTASWLVVVSPHGRIYCRDLGAGPTAEWACAGGAGARVAFARFVRLNHEIVLALLAHGSMLSVFKLGPGEVLELCRSTFRGPLADARAFVAEEERLYVVAVTADGESELLQYTIGEALNEARRAALGTYTTWAFYQGTARARRGPPSPGCRWGAERGRRHLRGRRGARRLQPGQRERRSAVAVAAGPHRARGRRRHHGHDAGALDGGQAADAGGPVRGPHADAAAVLAGHGRRDARVL